MATVNLSEFFYEESWAISNPDVYNFTGTSVISTTPAFPTSLGVALASIPGVVETITDGSYTTSLAFNYNIYQMSYESVANAGAMTVVFETTAGNITMSRSNEQVHIDLSAVGNSAHSFSSTGIFEATLFVADNDCSITYKASTNYLYGTTVGVGSNYETKSLSLGYIDQLLITGVQILIDPDSGYNGGPKLHRMEFSMPLSGNSISVSNPVGYAQWAASDIILDICTRAGIPEELVNPFDLEDIPVHGIMTSPKSDSYTAIEELSNLFMFDACNYDSRLYFIKRGGPVKVEIPYEDLVDDGAEVDKRERRDSIEIPKSLILEYMDLEGGLTPMKQYTDRSMDIRARKEEKIETGVILTAEQAAQSVAINHKVLIEEQKGGFTFSLPDSYLYLTVGDVVKFEGNRLRITSVKVEDGFQKYETVMDRASAYSSVIAGVPEPAPLTPPSIAVGATTLHFIDSHILSDNQDQVGFYVAVNGVDPWPGAVAQFSFDGGENYNMAGATTRPALFGTLITSLPSANKYIPDQVNTFRVSMHRNDANLLYTDLAGMMNRGNLALVGNEIIAFSEVDEVSPGIWDISYLLRGRKGSTVSSHSAGERFIVLQTSRLEFQPMETVTIGKDVTIRTYTTGAANASSVQSYTFNANSQKEREVNYLQAKRNGGNIDISWIGTGRLGGGGNVIHSANFTGYKVTINGTTTYSTTNQYVSVTDPSGSVTIDVVQVNKFTGDGPVTSITI